MKVVLYITISIVLTVLYNTWVWPAFWARPPFSPWRFVFDAVQIGLVLYYVHLHISRERRYGSRRSVWGNVIREAELAAIQANVATFHQQESEANCAACRGSGHILDQVQLAAQRILGETPNETPRQVCSACRGTGFTRGQVKPPFEVAYLGRNRVFLGFDAWTQEPVYLEEEDGYTTTHVYSLQGGGKTKRVANRILSHFFRDDNSTMIYFSLKAADADKIAELAKEAGWTVSTMKHVSLFEAFSSWSEFEEGLRMGMAAAGYATRESFWFDNAMQLVRDEYNRTLATSRTARLGPIFERVRLSLIAQARDGQNVKADQIAIADIYSYFRDFNNPMSPVRWLYDASPDDVVPGDDPSSWTQGCEPDWEPLAGSRHLVIVPPIEGSKAGVVAAATLKYSHLLWFDRNKARWQEPNPEFRHRIIWLQDEGDQFLLCSPTKNGKDDIYATKTLRESGLSSWIFTQSREEITRVCGDRAQGYFHIVGNTITIQVPDQALTPYIRDLPQYEFQRRTKTINRSSARYADHEKVVAGNLRVQIGESLSMVTGPWITGEIFQQLPKGCAVFQQAGATPRVIWLPYYRHVRLV